MGRTTIYDMVSSAQIPYYRIGSKIRLDGWLAVFGPEDEALPLVRTHLVHESLPAVGHKFSTDQPRLFGGLVCISVKRILDVRGGCCPQSLSIFLFSYDNIRVGRGNRDQGLCPLQLETLRGGICGMSGPGVDRLPIHGMANRISTARVHRDNLTINHDVVGLDPAIPSESRLRPSPRSVFAPVSEHQGD